MCSAVPYINGDKSTFAYVSFVKRYPAIFDNILSDLKAHIDEHQLAGVDADVGEIKYRFLDLKNSIKENREIPLVPASEPDHKIYNKLFEGQHLKWMNAPWLSSECLLYRLIEQIFKDSEHFKEFDYFSRVKNDTFLKSADAVSTLADRYTKIVDAGFEFGSEEHSILFHELLTTSLWGNATDLSLLVTVSMEELKKLQIAAADREKESLLTNDIPKVWKKLSHEKYGRVDIVLDNSGFEVYTDLILALFLLDSDLADQIVFHPKSHPWFISDVMPHDFPSVIHMLQNQGFFPKNREAVDRIVHKIQTYFELGQFVVRTSEFWTLPYSFHELTTDGVGTETYHTLMNSKLVIFKGDLNYRKLTADLNWPKNTPFQTAIGPLAVQAKLPFVTLRTIKADVCVGLPDGKEEELNKKWKSEHPDQPPQGWLWSGKYALINSNL